MSAPAKAALRPIVVVVDDEPMMRSLMTRALQPHCHVVAASDGQEALDLIWGMGDVGAVVTDIQMPRLDGLALAVGLRQMNNPPPMLFISAYGHGGELPGPYLAKPFLPDALVTAVGRLLGQQGLRLHSYQADPLTSL